jgi:hypothetical protein
LQVALPWLTTTVLPPIVKVALRGDVLVFAAIDTFTIPVPEPPGALRVIHETGLEAVQAQPVPAVIQTLATEAAPPTVIAEGDTE